MNKFNKHASMLVLASAVAACSTPVPQALNPSDVPPKFDGPIPSDVGVWPNKEWWHGFKSPELDDLIGQAETNNLDIAVATANVLAAAAQSNIERSALFPSLDANASAQRSQSSGARINAPGGAQNIAGRTQNSFSVLGNANYTLDIWGLTRDNVRAAEETLRSDRYAQEEVTLTAVSGVGTTYLQILALREEITITKKNIEDAKRVLAVTQSKLKYGVSSNLDLAQEEALVNQQESTLPVLQEQEDQARLALAILLGRPPEGFVVNAQNLDGIALPLVAPGLPSQLILRRPDVAEAEANLASAHANVDAARAAFFPAVSLTGSGGSVSTMAGLLFHAGTFQWTAGASALQTLFDAGKLFAQSDLAKAQQLALVATYRKTVISAFSNVETALGQTSNFASEVDALQRDVKASSEAERISELQYREGIVDLTTLIQTQQTLFTAQVSLAQAKLAYSQAVIGLYQSLGGGWSENPKENTQSVTGTTEASTKAPVPNPQDSMWKGIGSIMP